LLQTYEDPHCMHCKKAWGPEFLAANFTLTFRTGPLRKWRRKVLVEREKAALPAMQTFVEYKKEYNRINCERLRMQTDAYGVKSAEEYKRIPVEEWPLRQRLTHYQRAYEIKTQTYTGVRTALEHERAATIPDERMIKTLKTKCITLKKEKDEVYELYKNTKEEVNKLEERIGTMQTLLWHYQALYEGRATRDPREKREFIMKCPDEGCRGFLSTAYRCGTCEKWTCPDCLVVLGATKECGHTCDKEAAESAKMIKAETHPCPKCGTRIFKVEGCDQMWCVIEGCNTAFSWNTGQIETSRVHNPHYYEWLRRNGGGQAPREAGDIPCGGLPNAWEVARKMNRAAVPFALSNEVHEIHRHIVEIAEDRLPRLYPLNAPANMNKDIDVRYLMKETSAEEWERQLEIQETKFRRKRDVGLILQTLVLSASELFRELAAHEVATPAGPIRFRELLREKIVPQMEALRQYVNDELKKLGARERIAVPQLLEKCEWMTPRILYRATKAVQAADAGEETEVEELPAAPAAPTVPAAPTLAPV